MFAWLGKRILNVIFLKHSLCCVNSHSLEPDVYFGFVLRSNFLSCKSLENIFSVAESIFLQLVSYLQSNFVLKYISIYIDIYIYKCMYIYIYIYIYIFVCI